MCPSPDTSARAPPSLQWVLWPPLAGALQFPTFIGTMRFYDCSSIRGRTSTVSLDVRLPLSRAKMASSRGFLGNPC
jgi:hypothetical protein